MCGHCGCSVPDGVAAAASAHDGEGRHRHSHRHGSHDHDQAGDRRVVELSHALLGENARLAERVRGLLASRRVAGVNVMSSPGSGKTGLLARTLRDLEGRVAAGTIVGDLATDNDASRLRASGAPSVQVKTGTVCHLDAHMILHALEEIPLDTLDLLLIENVGNLVCPSAFDLGEDAKVVLTSVTEGEDKPLKYPAIFHDADLVLVSKIDLAEAVEANVEELCENVRDVAPHAEVMRVSSRTGEGLDAWYSWLERTLAEKRERKAYL